jgi:hypothetical protein
MNLLLKLDRRLFQDGKGHVQFMDANVTVIATVQDDTVLALAFKDLQGNKMSLRVQFRGALAMYDSKDELVFDMIRFSATWDPAGNGTYRMIFNSVDESTGRAVNNDCTIRFDWGGRLQGSLPAGVTGAELDVFESANANALNTSNVNIGFGGGIGRKNKKKVAFCGKEYVVRKDADKGLQYILCARKKVWLKDIRGKYKVVRV